MDASIIWTLRKPVIWVWRKLVGWAGAWTVEPIYRQANDYHLALRNWQRRWVELAANVEYKLMTRSSFDQDGNPEQSIWVRNTGTTLIDELHFCVEARLGSVSYQVPLAAYRLRPGCLARLPLIGLPLQDLSIRKDGLFATYESIRVYPIRIAREQRIDIYSTDGVVWTPSHDDYLNGEWKRWRGRLYNVKAMTDARRDHLLRLGHRWCRRHGLWGLDAASLFGEVWRTRRYKRLPGVLMFTLASRAPVINAMLWLRLLLRIERIAFEFDADMQAATEYVLKKGQSAGPVRVIHWDAASPTTTDSA
ncbi:hypothetical protein [Duganella violaceipulchra]|uniref:Uncharacterized protein n=1 Tax=Duganella violaceipulchra TaxID=2849652 RepID=A0AA41HFE1_9BURK|nr:hypothetical protein [Duganella violaceicalia]MBV6323957.1 hypothetical protein [Duganella violaceicalia]MCP2011061.1 hypothetical protein [Duganella violaceicalia]